MSDGDDASELENLCKEGVTMKRRARKRLMLSMRWKTNLLEDS